MRSLSKLFFNAFKIAATALAACGGEITHVDEAIPAPATRPGEPPAAPAPAPVGTEEPSAPDAPLPAGCSGQGTATVLASAPYADGLTVDDTGVYFASLANGVDSLLRVPLQGGNVASLATAPSGAVVWSLAVGESGLYWSTGPQGSLGLWRTDKVTGGSPTTLSSDGENGAIAVDASALFYPTGHEVRKVPLAGGAPVVLSPDTGELPTVLALDETDVYFVSLVFVDDARVASLRSVPKSGGPVRTVATGPVFSDVEQRMLVADESAVYFSSKIGGVVGKVTKTTGAVTTLAQASSPVDIVVGGGFLYWLEVDPATDHYGFVRRVGVNGGAVETIVKGAFMPKHGLGYRRGQIYVPTPTDVRAIKVCDAS